MRRLLPCATQYQSEWHHVQESASENLHNTLVTYLLYYMYTYSLYMYIVHLHVHVQLIHVHLHVHNSILLLSPFVRLSLLSPFLSLMLVCYSKTSESGHSEKRTHSLERTKLQVPIENPIFIIHYQPPRSDHL